MTRSVIGVLSGYVLFAFSAVIFFGLAARDPHSEAPVRFILISILFGACFGLVAGYIAARIAGRLPVLHGMMVGGLIMVGASMSLLARPGQGHIWTQLSAIFIFAPAAVAGGWLCSRVARVARSGNAAR